MQICFFGTPSFASFSLKKILDSGFSVCCVVTAPDKPQGRGLKISQSDVKLTALEYGIPVLQPTNLKSPDFIKELHQFKPDLGIVIAFRMLPEIVWNLPPMGTFNLHGSLLPNYRGAAPINHAIINGETQTGVSTFFLKHAIDTGDLIAQTICPILPNHTFGDLYEKLMHLGADLVVETLQLIKNNTVTLTQQSITGNEKHAPKIYREICEITDKKTVADNYNLFRGLSPFPGVWCNSSKLGEVKLSQVLPSDVAPQGTDFFVYNKALYWPCSNGSLHILKLKIPSKQEQDAANIINGYFK